jgi:hypothetical protein
MKVLLQLFEFSYPGGSMFLDRSGELCRRVATRWPGLSLVSIEPTEVKLHGASMGLEVWVGVRTAALQVTSPMEGGFAEAAAGFASDVWDVLQLNMVESFRLKQVTGRACASKAEAAELMSPLVPRESQERLQGIAAQPEWRAVQAE